MNQKAWKKPKDSDKGPFLNIVILFHPPIKFLHFSLSICYGHFQPRRAFSFPDSDCFECVVPLGCWGSHMLASLSLWPDSTNTPRSMGPDTKIAVNPAKHHQHHVVHRTHDNLDIIKSSRNHIYNKLKFRILFIHFSQTSYIIQSCKKSSVFREHPEVTSGKLKVGPHAPLSQRHQVEPTWEAVTSLCKKNQSRSQDIPRINSNLCFTYLEWRHWMNYTDWSKMIHWASADERLEEIDSLDWEWNFGPNARPLGVSVSRAFRSKSLSDSTFRVDMQTSPTLRACRFESWHQMSRPSWIMFQKSEFSGLCDFFLLWCLVMVIYHI